MRADSLGSAGEPLRPGRRPPRAGGGARGRGFEAESPRPAQWPGPAAPLRLLLPPSVRGPPVSPSFLRRLLASRYGAAPPARQHHLRIPEVAPAMEDDQELERHCVTFVLHEEDHTLGNSLRYMIMKNPEVEFCGYTTTHPSESKINLRIQTRGALPAVEPFQRGLTELMNVCQHVLDKFEASIKEYKDQKASRNEATF
ncbi:hypothetical protein DBR06_SOUSAS2610083 [Sousa chinensis]|nr:hypothetical protein DBR06_SOUSAS2610083 [Sousa chinensis]